MKCRDCPYQWWFGDYALWVCRINRDIINLDDECRCEEKRKEREKRDEELAKANKHVDDRSCH